MAFQNNCNKCNEFFPQDTLVYIRSQAQILCEDCINYLVDDLLSKIDDLKAELEAAEHGL